MSTQDTIVARATPPGRGGVGIVRISGPLAPTIATHLLGKLPSPRVAAYSKFLDAEENTIDLGLALYFPRPNSFTGEDVIELHGHGGPVIIELLIQRILQLGARLAEPGEFSERAFLNDQIDLAQAEAIADLIDSSSEQAARSAVRSLQGAFSNDVQAVVNELINLRVFVEAAIDFPEEEVDFLDEAKINSDLNNILEKLDTVKAKAKQGALLREGMHIVIAGKPNAGKSSLLNCLSGRESAIVTDIPGTTRDLLREHILIDGIPLHIIDTAGLRHSDDQVEQEGVRRAWQEITNADRVLLMVDSSETQETDPKLLWPDFQEFDLSNKAVTVIQNKIDKTAEEPGVNYINDVCVIKLSAKQDKGINLLRQHLKDCVGAQDFSASDYSARSRHLSSLEQARNYITTAMDQFAVNHAGELLAEDLRHAQQELGEITGEFTSDDLLGKIFSSFCIGK